MCDTTWAANKTYNHLTLCGASQHSHRNNNNYEKHRKNIKKHDILSGAVSSPCCCWSRLSVAAYDPDEVKKKCQRRVAGGTLVNHIKVAQRSFIILFKIYSYTYIHTPWKNFARVLKILLSAWKYTNLRVYYICIHATYIYIYIYNNMWYTYVIICT